MKIILALIFIAIACILSTRRLGWSWQAGAIYALVALAAGIGRFSA